MRERLERPAPQVEQAEAPARPLSRAEVEEKYLDILERPLGRAAEEAVDARAQQLLMEHKSSPDAIRAAWHEWRQALPQPEDAGVDPKVFRAVREENLAYADALRRSDPVLVEERAEAKARAISESLSELEPWAAALVGYEPAPPATIDREEPADRAVEALVREDTPLQAPCSLDPVYELSQQEPHQGRARLVTWLLLATRRSDSGLQSHGSRRLRVDPKTPRAVDGVSSGVV